LKQILGKLLTIIITSRKFSINSPYDTDRVNLLYILCDDDGIFINLTVPDGRDLCVFGCGVEYWFLLIQYNLGLSHSRKSLGFSLDC
jgi:hypothetical protein